MHVFITGGAGFIGSHLVEYHLAKGDRVHVVDNLSTGSSKNISHFQKDSNFHFTEADILTWPELDKATAWADRIYHMAAVVGVEKVLAEPINVLETNVAGSERLLRGIFKGGWNPQTILASTSEVYGSDARMALAEDERLIVRSDAGSRWNYAISKIVDEALGLAYSRKHNLKILIVRFFNTIGPRQTGRYGMVVPRFVEQAVHDKPICVFGDGLQVRSFCDVRDTVVLLDLLADNPASKGQIVNVGNDREISIRDLAELVKQVANSSSSIKHLSYKEAYGEDYDDIRFRKPALEKLFRLTHFKHRWTLEKTIEDLVKQTRQALLTKENV